MEEQHNITNNLLGKIQSGDVKMKSRYYFVIRNTLFFLAMAVVFLCIIYLISFTIFSLRVTGLWFLPGLGFVGIFMLLRSLPWVLIVVCIVLFVALEMFAEHISFVYKRPMAYSLLTLLAVVLVGGFLVERTALHNQVLYRIQEGRFQLVKPLYQDYGAKGANGVHHGIVQEINMPNFIIETPRGEMLQVLYIGSAPLQVEIGRAVIVVGDRQGDVINARLVKRVKENIEMFPSQRKLQMQEVK